MTLESAERLVEKILQQLQIKYEVSGDAAPHHDHDHDAEHGGEAPAIVVDAEAISKLPPELRPFVTPRTAPTE
jgi:hypothetical protein